MSKTQSWRTAFENPRVFLAAAGWVMTALMLAQYDLVFVAVILASGLGLWARNNRVSAFGIIQLGIGILAPTAPLAVLGLLESGPALLLASLLSEQGLSGRTIGAAIGIGVGLSAIVIAGFVAGGSLLAGCVTLVSVFGLCSYVIHRYELVMLGLVGGENA